MTPVSLLTSILDHSQPFFFFMHFPPYELICLNFWFRNIMDKRRHIVDYILIDFVTFFILFLLQNPREYI